MSSSNKYQVAIVGGGPVGLFLGCCLHQRDISCVVLEKRNQPVAHSRSIGIHPVALELFEKIGLAETVINEGIKVQKGHAYWNDKPVGTLSFQSCPPPYPFILTLPQHQTEQLLNQHLKSLGDEILHRGAALTGINELQDAVELEITTGGQSHEITADFVVGCDGKNSFVRRAASINFKGSPYSDTYIMGDFTDNTEFGNDAAIFLCDEGLIESFPLPGGVRRWVIKTDRYRPQITRKDIEQRVKKRISHNLKGTANKMLSSFGVEKKMASAMAKDRIILAGDAAHVISPIGGQGMNLGWLDAYDLTACLKEIFETGASPEPMLANYSARRLKIARKAARRAAFNMALGRKNGWPLVKKTLLKGLVRPPFSHLMARMFTMRGLQSWPV